MPASIGPSPPCITSPSKPPVKRKITSKSAQRPTTLSRKNTSQAITKLGASKREIQTEEAKELDNDDESFLNFCANCEKQIKGSNQSLYCSESCRSQDQTASRTIQRPVIPHIQASKPHIPFSSSSRLPSPPLSPFATHHTLTSEGPDIVARASPTTSRPRSYFGSDAYAFPLPTPSDSSYAVSVPSYYRSGPYIDPGQCQGSSTALASLRQLSTALEFAASRTNRKPSDSRSSIDSSSEDNAESTETSLARSSSAVWSYMTSSGRPARDQMSMTYSTQSMMGNNAETRPKTPKERGMSYTERRLEPAAVRGVDRPLPPRTANHRPRSIDLLTPFTGRV